MCDRPTLDDVYTKFLTEAIDNPMRSLICRIINYMFAWYYMKEELRKVAENASRVGETTQEASEKEGSKES